MTIISLLLVMSMLCSCGGNIGNQKYEQDCAMIRQKLDTYLQQDIFTEYAQSTKLYENYISCVSVNFLSSLIFLVDEKLGKMSSKWGFNEELATWIFEDYTGEIESLIYDKENISVLMDIVTKNCQTEILSIEPLEQEDTYSVQIQVTNLDLQQSIHAKEMVTTVIDNLEKDDLLNISSKGTIKGGIKGLVKGLVLGWGDKKKILKEVLTSILENCGENALLDLQKMLTTVVEDVAVTNTYTGTITVLVSNETVYIVEQDLNLANACHGVFDSGFLSMDTSSFYEQKVQELMELREERKAGATSEPEEELPEDTAEPSVTTDPNASSGETNSKEQDTSTDEENSEEQNTSTNEEKAEEQGTSTSEEKSDEQDSSANKTTEKAPDATETADTSGTENDTTRVPADSIEDLCKAFYETQDPYHYNGMKMPEKMKKYFDIPEDETVYLSHDATLFSSGKDGFVITNRGVYINKSFENKLYFVPFSDFNDTPTYTWDISELYANDILIAYASGLDDNEKAALVNLFTDIFLLNNKS